MRYKTYVTHKQDILSVYCLHVILFDFFFITLMLVYLQNLLNCLIIYSYKTNPSFSPCPWNLRSIGPSDFKKWQHGFFFLQEDGLRNVIILRFLCMSIIKQFNAITFLKLYYVDVQAKVSSVVLFRRCSSTKSSII